MIKTLIVMTTYGTIYFSKEYGKKNVETDVSLTAGLISAIYSMTTETEGEKIENLDLQEVRTIFKERQESLLFVLTIDKRMDEDDAQELLNDIINSFQTKYENKPIDGQILSDFEPVLDDIVNERIWYNTVEKKPNLVKLSIPFLAMLFSSFYYPLILINSDQFILSPLLLNLANPVTLVITGLIIAAMLIVPALITYYLIQKIGTVDKLLRFIEDFIFRPTRGGYAEILPGWFLLSVPLIATLLYSVIRYGRGFFYFLNFQVISVSSEQAVDASVGHGQIWTGVSLMYLSVLLSWLLIQPLVVGLVTGNLSKEFLKSTMIISSVSMLVLIPAQVIAGYQYQVFVGFTPDSSEFAARQISSLNFLFLVSIPMFLSFFFFVFTLGVGQSKITSKNQQRYPIAFGISILTSLIFQLLSFWLIFQSKWGLPYSVQIF